MRLITVPGVFRPRSDSRLLARVVADRTRPGSRAIDPFAGSGILAIAAALSGAAEVTAVDVSRRALACTRLNARLNGVRVQTRRGDMFAPVEGVRYDLIAANPPYLPGETPAPRGPARAWEGGPDGRAILDRLCAQAGEKLMPGGELLLVQSSICGVEKTLDALEAGRLEAEVIHRERGPLGPLLAERAEELESRGLLAPGQRDEEVVVIAARRAATRRFAPERPHMSRARG